MAPAGAGGSNRNGGSGGAGTNGGAGVDAASSQVGDASADRAPAETPPRQRLSVNKMGWRFRKADVMGAEQPGHDDRSWLAVNIPHDWNGGSDGVNDDVLKGPQMYRGIGWYRARFTVDRAHQGKQIAIEFEAVSLVADVWLNGVHLGQHKGAYTAFSFELGPHVKFGEENVLAVKANSANDRTVAPWMQVPFGLYPGSYDYAVYGGIYRDVWLTITGKTKVEAVFVDTPQISAASAQVRVRTEVRNHEAAPRMVTLTTRVLDPAGAEVASLTTAESVAAGKLHTFDQTSAALAHPRLWSPSEPVLYRAVSTVTVDGQASDRVESPFGFRFFRLPKQGAFTLNGRNFLLRGVNRHQDRLGVGYAMTDDEHRRDVELMKETGFNFLRHAHYPPDPAIMRAANELGMLVGMEIPVTVSISPDPGFLANAKAQLTEMIRQNYNHPSVIAWGLGNESDQAVDRSHPALTEAYTNRFHRELNDLAHQLDATRPTTGCNYKLASNQAIVDVYSPQAWAGWYQGDVYVGKYTPTQLIGEYGADSALDRHREPGTARRNDWSQTYQASFHEYYAAESENRKDLFPGYATFVMFDFASPRADRTTPNTIKYVNQKGLFLHDHKTPKDVAHFYRSFLTAGRAKPMVYLVSHTWLNRWTAPGAKTVWAYSNCDQVRLYNGNELLGMRTRSDGEHPTVKTRFQWSNVNVRYNLLKVEGLIDGKVVATDQIVLQNLPPPP